MQHPHQFLHWQMFMQDDVRYQCSHLQLLCYFMWLQFMIGQKQVWTFLNVFQDNCWIWRRWAFSIICICTIVFKVNKSFLKLRVRIICIKFGRNSCSDTTMSLLSTLLSHLSINHENRCFTNLTLNLLSVTLSSHVHRFTFYSIHVTQKSIFLSSS